VGFEDPDGVEHRGIEWASYEPGVQIALVQSKTGNPVVLPLSIDVPADGGGTERVALYPELEEELARARASAPAGAEIIVLESGAGRSTRSGACRRSTARSASLPGCRRR